MTEGELRQMAAVIQAEKEQLRQMAAERAQIEDRDSVHCAEREYERLASCLRWPISPPDLVRIAGDDIFTDGVRPLVPRNIVVPNIISEEHMHTPRRGRTAHAVLTPEKLQRLPHKPQLGPQKSFLVPGSIEPATQHFHRAGAQQVPRAEVHHPAGLHQAGNMPDFVSSRAPASWQSIAT